MWHTQFVVAIVAVVIVAVIATGIVAVVVVVACTLSLFDFIACLSLELFSPRSPVRSRWSVTLLGRFGNSHKDYDLDMLAELWLQILPYHTHTNTHTRLNCSATHQACIYINILEYIYKKIGKREKKQKKISHKFRHSSHKIRRRASTFFYKYFHF